MKENLRLLPDHVWRRTDDDALAELYLSLMVPKKYHKRLQAIVAKKKITLREYFCKVIEKSLRN